MAGHCTPGVARASLPRVNHHTSEGFQLTPQAAAGRQSGICQATSCQAAYFLSSGDIAHQVAYLLRRRELGEHLLSSVYVLDDVFDDP